jgi:hypothetical protein
MLSVVFGLPSPGVVAPVERELGHGRVLGLGLVATLPALVRAAAGSWASPGLGKCSGGATVVTLPE